jgi:hypothetical protein
LLEDVPFNREKKMRIPKLALLTALLVVIFLGSGSVFEEKTTAAQGCLPYYYELYNPSGTCYGDGTMDISVGFRGNWPDGSDLAYGVYTDQEVTLNTSFLDQKAGTFDNPDSIFAGFWVLGSDDTITEWSSLTIDGALMWRSNVIYDCSGGEGAAVVTNQVTDNTCYVSPDDDGDDKVPGCDSFVDLPSTAVVGALTGDANVFWKPGNQADPTITLDAGKTYWVDGLDSTGQYRRILLTCSWWWVEASKVGPNYDDVWHGTPLPTHTVK